MTFFVSTLFSLVDVLATRGVEFTAGYISIMPQQDHPCHICGRVIRWNNMSRHMKVVHAKTSDRRSSGHGSHDRENIQSSRGPSVADQPTTPSSSTSVSSDYIRDAVLCMLRKVDGINLPSLSAYLEVCFPDLPESWRMPVIVATYSAAQKVAATHQDALMSTGDERDIWAKRSLIRWAHGLSAVEPVKARGFNSSSHLSMIHEPYSPVNNYLLTRDVPVGLNSAYGRTQLENALIDVESGYDGNSTTTTMPANLFSNDVPPTGGLISGAATSLACVPVVNVASVLTSVAVSAASAGIDAVPTISVESTGVTASVDNSNVNQDPDHGGRVQISTPLQDEPPSPNQELERGTASHDPQDAVDANQSELVSAVDSMRPRESEVISFSDLLQIEDADPAILSDLSRPLVDCLSPLNSPTPAVEVSANPSVALRDPVTSSHEVHEQRLALQLPLGKKDEARPGMVRKKKTDSHHSSSSSDSQSEDRENRKRRSSSDSRSAEYGSKTDPKGSPKRSKYAKSDLVQKSPRRKVESAVNKPAEFKIPLKARQSSLRPSSGSHGHRSLPPVMSKAEARRSFGQWRRGSGGFRNARDGDRDVPRFRPPDGHDRLGSLSAEQRRWLERMPIGWR